MTFIDERHNFSMNYKLAKVIKNGFSASLTCYTTKSERYTTINCFVPSL